MEYKKLNLANGQFIAYSKFTVKEKISKNNNFTVIFLSGFMSDMQGSKAMFLDEFCRSNNVNFIRFDYCGTGHSSGKFIDMSIGEWKQNAIEVINNITETDKVLLIGSSMGSWIMSLIAKEIPRKICGMIGIASAPDFTEKLIWDVLSSEARKQIEEKGVYNMPTEYCNDPNDPNSTYPITKKLIEDGRRNQIFVNGNIKIDCPVTLIHGMQDEDVPYNFSMKLADIYSSQNVEVILQPSGKHRMSEPADLSLLQSALQKHIINMQ